MDEYTPGYLTPPSTPTLSALLAASEPANHRSGFHSAASSPQIAVLRFEAMIDTRMVVFASRGIVETAWPSTERTGVCSGRDVGSFVL